MNVVITGANRGIGLGFVHHYLEHGCEVWAGYRREAGGLAEFDDPRLHAVQLDVTGDIRASLSKLPDRIDLLINNAGIYGPNTQSLETVTPEIMRQVFEVDCIGPLRVVQALKERVIAARGVIANISSKMGSSTDNTSGGYYAYRAAKAALVIVSRSMAIDLAPTGVHVITLHPGWVKTDMGGHAAPVEVSDAVRGMAKVLSHVDGYEPGAFVAFDGGPVPY
jgi:NAD(P)-dependent dehydrogenase (short-subunit alcohol dehydrogenase family)